MLHEPVYIFTVVLLIVLLTPLLLARWRLPAVAGLILAGMAAGPHGAGWLVRDGTFELLGSVGLLYLMFLVGLEIDIREFRARFRESAIFGGLTFAIPMLLGMPLARWMGFSWAASVLIASMFASHTLISFPIVQTLGIVRHRVVTTTVGGTILTDTAALLVLAVIAEGAREGAAVNWPLQIALMGFVLVFAFALLPRIATWFFREAEPDGIAEYVFILAAGFATASLAHLAGVESIIGAFLAGLGLSSLVPGQSVLMKRLEFTGHALFIPFFLLSTGMLIEPQVLVRDGRTIAVCAFMTATVLVAKWLAADLAGRWLGYRRDERVLLFGLSVNQAAATLAAVIVGMKVGVVDESVLNGAISMILVSCVLGPLATQAAGVHLVETGGAGASGDAATGGPTGPLLLAVSREATAAGLADLSMLVRDAASQQAVHVLNVVTDEAAGDDDVAASEHLLGLTLARFAAGGIRATTHVRVEVSAVRALLRALRETRAGTLIMGWSGSSAAKQFFFRTVAMQLLPDSECMAVIARISHPPNTDRRALVLAPPLIERHPGTRLALCTVQQLARQLGCPVHWIGTRETLDALQELLAPQRTEPRVVCTGLKASAAVLRDQVGDRDVVILLNNRAGLPGWHPAVDGIPADLLRRVPSANVVVVYPPRGGASGATPVAEDVRMETFRLRGAPGQPATAAARVLQAAGGWGGGRRAREWAEALRVAEPIELAPGLALVHAHIHGLPAPRILRGEFADDECWPDVAAPVRTVIVLLSPAERPPAEHLATLGAIVRAVGEKRLPVA